MVGLEEITTTLCNHSSNVHPDLRTRLTHFVQIPTPAMLLAGESLPPENEMSQPLALKAIHFEFDKSALESRNVWMKAAVREATQVRYLNLSWRQTHDARLASYEISAALAEQSLAEAAADAEADADRQADQN